MSAQSHASTCLLNWDHEIIPTKLSDLLFNLTHEIMRFTGNKQVQVTFDDGQLVVMAVKTSTFSRGSSFGTSCEPYWNRALQVDTTHPYGYERVGRVHNYMAVPLSTLVDQLLAAPKE